MAHRLEKNIWKLYLLSGLHSFLLIIPILVIFQQSKGLTLREVFIIQAAFSLIAVVSEIPTGYFADRFGRKISLIIGFLFASGGMVIYSFGENFIQFFTAEAILGLGYSFISGADSALLYDTLLSLKREEEYKRAEGKVFAVSSYSEALASLLGGLLAAVAIRLPFYAEAGVLAAGVLVAAAIREPPFHATSVTARPSIRDILSFCVRHKSGLNGLLWYSAIIGPATLVMVWFTQPYWKSLGVPLAYFGVLWALLLLAKGTFALCAHRIKKRFGISNSLSLLLVLVTVGYLLMGAFPSLWILPVLLIFHFVVATSVPILRDAVNQRTESRVRATVLSIQALLRRLVFVIVGPLIGAISDAFSLQTALLSAAVVFALAGLPALLLMRRHGI